MMVAFEVMGGLIGISVILLSVMWVITTGRYPVARTVQDDETLSTIEANGYRFHSETFGLSNHPVIIVVHGGPGWDYRSLLPLQSLSDTHFVVFYDQRGTGLSSRVARSELTLATSLEDLDAIVEKYRTDEKITLIGHSWGAMLATAYIGQHPDKVNQVVLIEPGFLNAETFKQSGVRFGPRWEIGYLWFVTKRWFESRHIDAPDANAAKDYFMGEAASEANSEYYCGGVVPDSGRLRWRAGATAMQAIMSSAIDQQGNFKIDLTKGLNLFHGEVLLLASECNKLIGIEQQKRHQRYFVHSRLEVIPACGHMMISERTAETLGVIRRYLETGQ